jgi:Carboxypeptidase regulatory-like domain
MPFQPKSRLALLTLICLIAPVYCMAQSSPPASSSSPLLQLPSGAPEISPDAQPTSPASPGTINGTVVDQSGAVVAGAEIDLQRAGQSLRPAVISDSDGGFSFIGIDPGPFELKVSSSGFAPKTVSGILRPGEIETMPDVLMDVASALTEVSVRLSQVEVAEEEIKVEEQQRILGIVPNFYVSYVPDAAPLTPKQKFRLAARSIIDPFTFFVVAASAGVEQADGHFHGYGQGTEGYAKRFGANYADAVTGTFIGGAILPSLLKQDPRYFYKGTGSVESRTVYALGMSVIQKGDNGRWQPGYSNILGSLAAGGISNIYYPADDRNGAELTFVNAAINIASNAVTNLLQEFVIRKFTPKTHDTADLRPPH